MRSKRGPLTITRPTTVGSAFLDAAIREIMKHNTQIDRVCENSRIHWVARRIAAMQGEVGTVTVPTSCHNLATPEDREKHRKMLMS